MSLSPLVEKHFSFNECDYAVQCWGDPEDFPILALHGWLDNSESFSVLAEQLNGVYLIAPDLAGHGLTHQRLGFAEYALWSETNELFAIADALGLVQFALLGHSRGAMMAHMLAGIVPERISHVILLDAIVPDSITIKDMLPRIRKRYQVIKNIAHSTSYFGDRAAAVRARCQSEFGSISRDNAERLAKRGVSEKNGQYYWHADSKLKVYPSIGLTAEQIKHLLSAVAAPTLALVANQGLVQQQDGAQAKLSEDVIQANGIVVKMIDDGHFLHMSDSAGVVASEISRFIGVKE